MPEQEQDSLITVVEDELITAETTNKNNRYLESTMINYAGELRQYLQTQNTALRNDLENEINTAKNELQGNIDTLNTKVNNIKFFPNYNAAQSRSVDTNYTATEPGWVFVWAMSHNARQCYYYINDVQYFLTGCINQDTDTGAAGAWFPVSVGDKYKMSSQYTQFYVGIKFFPMKG